MSFWKAMERNDATLYIMSVFPHGSGPQGHYVDNDFGQGRGGRRIHYPEQRP